MITDILRAYQDGRTVSWMECFAIPQHFVKYHGFSIKFRKNLASGFLGSVFSIDVPKGEFDLYYMTL